MLDRLTANGQTGLLVGGEWREGPGSIEVVDPATEEVIAEVAAAGESEAEAAVDAAAEAAGAWAASPPHRRGSGLARQ